MSRLASDLLALAMDDDLIDEVSRRLGPLPAPPANPGRPGVVSETVRQVLAVTAEALEGRP